MPNNFSLVVFLIIDCTTRISKKYRRYWQSNGICWCFRLTDCQRTTEKSFVWRFLLWSNQAINIILHKKVLLSAKPVKSVSFTRRNKSLRKISNNNDPRTGPCGTLEQRFPPWTIHMASSCTLFFVWKMILDLMLWVLLLSIHVATHILKVWKDLLERWFQVLSPHQKNKSTFLKI